MGIATITSHSLRGKWREMLEQIAHGSHYVIQRFSKPVAVVIPYEEWLKYEEWVTERRQSEVQQAAIQQTNDWEEEANPDDMAWEREQAEAIEREMVTYRQMHPQLYALYANQYIAMYEGKVVDRGMDEVALNRRIRQRYGDVPVLLTPVLEEPVQTLFVRSPHLVQG